MGASSDQRILFYLPDMSRPVGGVNVTLEMIAVLRDAGIDAHPLYARPKSGYRYAPSDVPGGFFDRRLIAAQVGTGRVGQTATALLRLRAETDRLIGVRASSQRLAKLDLRPSDIVVIPDWAFDKLTDLYPNTRQVLLVQGMEPLYNGFGARAEAGARRLVATLTTSCATTDAAALLPIPEPIALTLAVRASHDSPPEPKQRQIAYMPRKTPHLTRAVTLALSALPELRDYAFVAIDDMSAREVDRALAASLIFLSLVRLEGFGLPAAEALRSECIVIGFDGVGGREFLDTETGVPVPMGDAVGIVEAVRATVREYDHDPTRLDAMRKRGAARISQRYTHAAFRDGVLAAFESILARTKGAFP